MNKKISEAGKNLLLNTLHSVEHQNRLSEENETWKSHGRCGRSNERNNYQSSSRRSHSEERVSNHGRKRRRRESEHDIDSKYDSGTQSADCAKHWIKRLYELKASDRSRWTHDGYKELYPQYFASSSSSSSASLSDDSDNDSSRKNKRSRKKKKSKKKKSKKKK